MGLKPALFSVYLLRGLPMNLRQTCLLCAGLVTTLGIIWMVGLPLQAGHAGSAAGVGSVYVANVQQGLVRHRRPVSLRMLARVLNDCEQKASHIIRIGSVGIASTLFRGRSKHLSKIWRSVIWSSFFPIYIEHNQLIGSSTFAVSVSSFLHGYSVRFNVSCCVSRVAG